MALRIILAMSWWSVTQLLIRRNPHCSPEGSCHKTEWETSGFQPKIICMASCINSQAFPAVPNISGNFLIQGSGRQFHSLTCYLLMVSLYYITYFEKLPRLCCFTEQCRTHWSNTKAKLYRRWLKMFRKQSTFLACSYRIFLWSIHMYSS